MFTRLGGFVDYVTAWSHLPLPLIRTDPLNEAHISPERLAWLNSHKEMDFTCYQSRMLLLAASDYTARAKGYERDLLNSLGLSPHNLEDFVEKRKAFGDHFQINPYDWQVDERAVMVIAEMTGLHDTVSRAWHKVAEWQNSVEVFPDATENLEQADLQNPLISLQRLLLERATLASQVCEAYNNNMEAGLRVYFCHTTDSTLLSANLPSAKAAVG